MNPLPDAMGRATRAARRSVEIDPGCRFGWSRLMSTSFYTNDRAGMRNAGDRVTALNPLNQDSVGIGGVYIALLGGASADPSDASVLLPQEGQVHACSRVGRTISPAELIRTISGK